MLWGVFALCGAARRPLGGLRRAGAAGRAAASARVDAAPHLQRFHRGSLPPPPPPPPCRAPPTPLIPSAPPRRRTQIADLRSGSQQEAGELAGRAAELAAALDAAKREAAAARGDAEYAADRAAMLEKSWAEAQQVWLRWLRWGGGGVVGGAECSPFLFFSGGCRPAHYNGGCSKQVGPARMRWAGGSLQGKWLV
jgi:hypothetical protein